MKTKKEKEVLLLNQRDQCVLYFVFQMRFATSMQIMKACFSETLDGKKRSSDLYIKRRLAKLVANKFLTTHLPPVGGSQKYLYSVTRKSLSILESKGLPTLVSNVPKYRTQDFDHDLHVIDCRLALERSKRATDWIPEFQIRGRFNAFEKLPAKYIPDGLFINKHGELTAFEMEIARKSKERYDDKIQKYVSLVRSHFNEEIKFKRVLFVAKHKDVQKILSDMTRINADIFRVESFESIAEGL